MNDKLNMKTSVFRKLLLRWTLCCMPSGCY